MQYIFGFMLENTIDKAISFYKNYDDMRYILMLGIYYELINWIMMILNHKYTLFHPAFKLPNENEAKTILERINEYNPIADADISKVLKIQNKKLNNFYEKTFKYRNIHAYIMKRFKIHANPIFESLYSYDLENMILVIDDNVDFLLYTLHDIIDNNIRDVEENYCACYVLLDFMNDIHLDSYKLGDNASLYLDMLINCTFDIQNDFIRCIIEFASGKQTIDTYAKYVATNITTSSCDYNYEFVASILIKNGLFKNVFNKIYMEIYPEV